MVVTICYNKEASPQDPAIVDGCDVIDFDFISCAKQAYSAINALYLMDLIEEMPFGDYEEINDLIYTLLEEIDLDDPSFQQEKKAHIRLQYIDYVLTIEVVLGV